MTDKHVHQLDESDVSGPPPGTPLATPVLAELRGFIHRAVEKHGQGEPVRYELSMFPLPTEQFDTDGNQQLTAMLCLYIEIRGAKLGTQISSTLVVQPSGHTEEKWDEFVRDLLEGARQARSGQLAQQLADAKAANERGEPAPVSGLITPGARPNVAFDDRERAMNGFMRGE